MKRLMREPLVHFLLGGALLFALFEVVAEDSSYAPGRIVVDERQIDNLSATFQRTWLRPPSSTELDGLIRDFIDEEILYREGLALGLDREDPVIRRRIRQKMEYLHTDLAERGRPTDADLAAFLSANGERFMEREKLSFRQVFVSPSVGTALATRRANELLKKLEAGASTSSVPGDPSLLPGDMTKASELDVAANFGPGFAADLQSLEIGHWQGPVASSFGLHLVAIDERIAARMPELAEVRREVERDYEAIARDEAKERYLRALRERYEVEVRTSGGEFSASAEASEG
jgi:hypothetical protein